MPELPEVQTIIDDLNKIILNKKIKKVDILLSKIVKGTNKNFINTLKNNGFQSISRRGKFIIISLKSNKFLIIHLRMTGQIIYVQDNNLVAGGHSDRNNNYSFPNKQTHLIITFNDNSQLFYNDQRQFGFLEIVSQKEVDILKNRLGVEPLSAKFTLGNFKSLLKGKKRNIKAFLLDQSCIAGLGNIYVDESLFLAHILPSRLMNSLKEKEIKDLHQSIKKVLRQAIKHRGTTFNNYKDAHGRKGSFINKLKVYGQENKKCVRCKKGIIKKTRLAGRGTRYCSNCQK
jgi:formamidopyrimidine-DNA glycosylase